MDLAARENGAGRGFPMEKSSTGIVALTVLALAGFAGAPASAEARGGWPAPRVSVVVGFGHPAFPVGAVVAPRYAHRVFYQGSHGYGFWAPIAYCSLHGVRDAHFVPVRRYRTGWVVVGLGSGVHGHRHHRGY
jgi:hypothetical protein